MAKMKTLDVLNQATAQVTHLQAQAEEFAHHENINVGLLLEAAFPGTCLVHEDTIENLTWDRAVGSLSHHNQVKIGFANPEARFNQDYAEFSDDLPFHPPGVEVYIDKRNSKKVLQLDFNQDAEGLYDWLYQIASKRVDKLRREARALASKVETARENLKTVPEVTLQNGDLQIAASAQKNAENAR